MGDRERPLDVEGAPQFGWMPSSAKGDDVQTAYEILLSGPSGQVWDSGRVASSDQSYVAYGGPALAPGTSYSWTVRTWDRDGEASPYAPEASFDTGLGDHDWSGAEWIRRVTSGNDSTDDYTLARKQFDVGAGGGAVVRARVYISAMGQYELHVNGRAVYRGDSFDYPGEGQYSAVDITDDVAAGQPLALGVLYHYWTCTCQGRANGPASTARLSAAAAGDTTLNVDNAGAFDAGDQATVGSQTVTVTAIGAGTIAISPALAQAQANRATVTDLAGPSGMLLKAVVDHADGSRDTFVSDGSWKVAKAAQYLNGAPVYRNGDAGDREELYDARNETPGWDTAGFDDSAWANAYAIGPHPRPVNPLRDEFSHLDPSLSELDYETVHPKSVTTLADGTVVADFGEVISAHPQIALHAGVAGRTLSMLTSYRLNNTTLSAPVAAGDTAVQVASASSFAAGDRITVDGPADGFGAGDPEVRTIASVAGTTITLDRALSRAHASGRWVEGSRAGTSGLDTQGSRMGWSYTEKDGPQTARTFTYWGWRYLQISGAGEPLTADDISAVVQYAHAPQDRRATFASDNRTLNDVFDLMQRSGRYSSQETFLDTPTREKGQFTGDTVDISFANMSALGDRNATRRAIKLLTDASADGPAKILAEGGTFMWEQWDPGCATSPCTNPSQSSSESMSHGWGAWGVVDVLQTLLGVTVTSPGAATVRIAPPALSGADLHHVSGSVWTQRGTVSVKWTRTGAGYVLDVHVPDNVTATVALPDGRHYVGVGDGAPRQVGDGVFTVGSGDTHFSPGATGTLPVGGTVPPTLALSLGGPAAFGPFTPGVDRTYTAATTADVVSTAGDAALTAAGPVIDHDEPKVR